VNKVGIISIVPGVAVVCSRGALLVAPAATLRWFEGLIRTNGRTRAFGMVILALGASIVWAGSTEHSSLATILLIAGWAFVGVSTLALVLFPTVHRTIAEAVLPSDTDADLSGWRILGLVGVLIGGALIYFGALAL
jgi:hypothetical protein